MKYYNSVTEYIGNTPLFKLNNLMKSENLKANLFAKAEKFNPAGSAKDRVALSMIKSAEENGLNKGGTVIEPTSGNTGIGIAMCACALGYKAVIVMPNNMSAERVLTIKAFGAEVVLTDAKLGMKGAIEKATELNKNIKNSVILGQFDNPSNPKAHYETTAPEIYFALDKKVDIFIAGIGTGGTISGVGKYLKEKIPTVKIIGVEPASSPLISKGYFGAHKIQGIGANFIPSTFDNTVVDEIVSITNEDAYFYTKETVLKEGLFVGISSGAVITAGILEALKEENKGKNIVVLLPDTGDRYLSVEGLI